MYITKINKNTTVGLNSFYYQIIISETFRIFPFFPGRHDLQFINYVSFPRVCQVFAFFSSVLSISSGPVPGRAAWALVLAGDSLVCVGCAWSLIRVVARSLVCSSGGLRIGLDRWLKVCVVWGVVNARAGSRCSMFINTTPFRRLTIPGRTWDWEKKRLDMVLDFLNTSLKDIGQSHNLNQTHSNKVWHGLLPFQRKYKRLETKTNKSGRKRTPAIDNFYAKSKKR